MGVGGVVGMGTRETGGGEGEKYKLHHLQPGEKFFVFPFLSVFFSPVFFFFFSTRF